MLMYSVGRELVAEIPTLSSGARCRSLQFSGELGCVRAVVSGLLASDSEDGVRYAATQ